MYLRRQLAHANESSDRDKERVREVETKMEEMKEKQQEDIGMREEFHL